MSDLFDSTRLSPGLLAKPIRAPISGQGKRQGSVGRMPERFTGPHLACVRRLGWQAKADALRY